MSADEALPLQLAGMAEVDQKTQPKTGRLEVVEELGAVDVVEIGQGLRSW